MSDRWLKEALEKALFEVLVQRQFVERSLDFEAVKAVVRRTIFENCPETGDGFIGDHVLIVDVSTPEDRAAQRMNFSLEARTPFGAACLAKMRSRSLE